MLLPAHPLDPTSVLEPSEILSTPVLTENMLAKHSAHSASANKNSVGAFAGVSSVLVKIGRILQG